MITGAANSRQESARARLQAWTGGGNTSPHHVRDRQSAQHRRGCGQAANVVRKRRLQLAAKHAPRRHGDEKKAETKARGSNKALSMGGHAVPTCSTVCCTFEPRLWQRPRPQKCVSAFLRNECRTWSASMLGSPRVLRSGAIRECYLHQHTGRNAPNSSVMARSPSVRE